MSVAGRAAPQGAALATEGEAETRAGGRGAVVAALVTLYLVWGSTYLAIAVAIEGFPPFLMSGFRFAIAGALLYAFLRVRGAPDPTRVEWRSAALVGTLLILGGNSGVAFAEQWVASGVAAVVVATTPIWVALFAGLWGRWPTRLEWTGLALGLAGVVLLNTGGDLRAHPLGAAVLVIATLTWALGSMWSRHVPLPAGMMATAAEMLAGGAVTLVFGLAVGERMTEVPSVRALGAFVYLIAIGSLVGFSSFIFLLGRVRPALATSYAYVNPIVALALGAALAGERIGGTTVVSVAIILGGVGLVALARERTKAG